MADKINKIEADIIQRSDSSSSEFSSSKSDNDQATLAQMGKKQILKRKFGFMSIISFSCTILNTWEGVIISGLRTGLFNGGTIGLLGQFMLSWIGTLSTFVVIGELASMAPTAGGQYHWVAMLSPRPMRNFLSYITGWMTCLAWLACIAGGAYLFASIVTTLIQIDDTSYVSTYQPYQISLICWALLAVCVFVNTVVGQKLPHIEGVFLVVHILGFFGILIPLLYYSPKATAAQVFADPIARFNGGNWPTYGLSFMIGTLGQAGSFAGADAAVHMSEEIANATVNVPRSILASVLINGVLGFAMLIALLFCMGDPQAALTAGEEYGWPFIGIFLQATGSKAGATAMSAILVAMIFAGSVGFIATGSRMVWSFARDRGLPFSSALTKVTPHTRIPSLAVLLVAIIPALLNLITIGSTSVFYALASLILVGYYSTYLIACSLLLYHRLRNDILTPDPDTTPPPAYQDPESGRYVLTWGKWRLRGIWGTLNNLFACCYLVSITVFSFFPSATPTNAKEMNWSCVVFGAVVLYSVGYWFWKGKARYTGPVVEVVG